MSSQVAPGTGWALPGAPSGAPRPPARAGAAGRTRPPQRVPAPGTHQGRRSPVRTQQRRGPPVQDPTPRKPRPSGVGRRTAAVTPAAGDRHTHACTQRRPLPTPTAHTAAVRGRTVTTEPANSTGRFTTKVTTGRTVLCHMGSHSGMLRKEGQQPLSPPSRPPLGRGPPRPERFLRAGAHPPCWLSHPEGQLPGGTPPARAGPPGPAAVRAHGGGPDTAARGGQRRGKATRSKPHARQPRLPPQH